MGVSYVSGNPLGRHYAGWLKYSIKLEVFRSTSNKPGQLPFMPPSEKQLLETC